MDDTGVPIGSSSAEIPPSLDLSLLPPVYVIAAHLSTEEQHKAEDVLVDAGAPLTYDIKEASIVIGNISKARRAKSELLWKGIRVQDIDAGKARQSPISSPSSSSSSSSEASTPAKKRRKVVKGQAYDSQRSITTTASSSTTASQTQDEAAQNTKPMSQLSLSRRSSSSTVGSSNTVLAKEDSPPAFDPRSFTGKVKVITLEWLNKSLSAGKALDVNEYIVYEGVPLPPEPAASSSLPAKTKPGIDYSKSTARINLEEQSLTGQITGEGTKTIPKPKNTRNDQQEYVKSARPSDFQDKSFSSTSKFRSQRPNKFITKPTQLLRQTTSEHEEAATVSLPPMPDWVLQNKIYACERATPLKSPNQEFICQLKKIKLARLLNLDEIGVRAYSSSIASLAAYPHPIKSTQEVLALPSCDQKIASLFNEWKSNNGHIQDVADIDADPEQTVLREFYEIWGVGAKTAREFYFDKGWRDLDDIIEYGWKSISRVQQIGIKYYDEFLLKIPRSEVEAITAVIRQHAKLVTDENVEAIIVGGHRRGKPESGDADVILSHREASMTHNLVDRVVRSLEEAGWITHTLTLNLTNTKRNQEPLPINTATQVGHGFDTLDKALVVWQDPDWPTKDADLAANPKAKNPNLHRRVDIIISPWRTIGCAVAGWTSGTTFQRDLRRYAKYVKGWKFDSSGVRERGTGRWVDLEKWTDPKTRCQDWKEAEKRVFEGMGLVYREPWDRCTG